MSLCNIWALLFEKGSWLSDGTQLRFGTKFRRKLIDPSCLVLVLASVLSVGTLTGAVPLGAHAVCARIPGLSDRQRAMCRSAPEAVAAVGDGVRLGYEECRNQFAGHRWNCSGLGEGNVFGHVMVVASKEAAFAYAITSAGVTYALTAACARGNISSCGCRSPRRSPETSPGGAFQWGGCGADVAYGVRFARKFLDSRELEGDARSLMNLHNNRVGRKIIKSVLRTECKCHGVSGSCALKTCWRALPPFSEVGAALMAKYRRARAVTAVISDGNVDEEIKDNSIVRRTGRMNRFSLVLRRSKVQGSNPKKIPKKTDLVFLQASPNYCDKDLAVGSFGTIGRYCNRTSKDHNSCEMLCCGRGYNTHQYVLTSQCNCKFHWCCRVQCDICKEQREDFTCK